MIQEPQRRARSIVLKVLAITAVSLHLATNGEAVALETTERHLAAPTPPMMAAAPPAPSTVGQKIEAQLAVAASPLTAAALRKLCRVRNATLTAALADLVAAGRVRKDPTGYTISR